MKMSEIQITIKDSERLYGFILNKKLIIDDYELVDELEYKIIEDIKSMIQRYDGLIKESE